jgi:hypothetical protein
MFTYVSVEHTASAFTMKMARSIVPHPFAETNPFAKLLHTQKLYFLAFNLSPHKKIFQAAVIH